VSQLVAGNEQQQGHNQQKSIPKSFTQEITVFRTINRQVAGQSSSFRADVASKILLGNNNLNISKCSNVHFTPWLACLLVASKYATHFEKMFFKMGNFPKQEWTLNMFETTT